MSITDPIADGLTKIRNASKAFHPTVDLPASKQIENLLIVLQKEGFIRTFKVVGETPKDKTARVYLKYVNKTPVIRELQRVSRPGQRIYRKASTLPRILRGLGTAVVTTSKGVMTERDAYRQRIGGEVICTVW